ncbi:MAG: helicase-associated domain-containing protein [Planctomycetes bacterium]|nr:helicase-associated domain-containing protein [Planctomycetota bacterium]
MQEPDLDALSRDLVVLVRAVEREPPRLLADGLPGRRFLRLLDPLLGRPDGARGEGPLDSFHRSDRPLLVLDLAMGLGLARVEGARLVGAGEEALLRHLGRPQRERVQACFEAWLRLGRWLDLFHVPELVFLREAAYYSDDREPFERRHSEARRLVVAMLDPLGPSVWTAAADVARRVETLHPWFLFGEPARHGQHYRWVFERDGPREGRGLPREGHWHRVEGRFVHRVLLGSLFDLGLTRRALAADGRPVFALTPEGAWCLGLGPEPPPRVRGAGPGLVVQADFEVLAYADSLDPMDLARLSRFAEQRSGGPVPAFRIHRAGVLRSLGAGAGGDERSLLESLSAAPLPPNVAYELEAWSRQHGDVTLWPSATVVEFESGAERDAFVAARGTALGAARALGERCLQVPGEVDLRGVLEGPVAWLACDDPGRRPLVVKEDGQVLLARDEADLDTLHRLRLLAQSAWEDDEELAFELNPAALRRARRQHGLDAEAARAFLEGRSCTGLPGPLAERIEREMG